MSGIVGIYYLDGRPVDRENLIKMVDILAHRGPDGADIWVNGCVGLGHRMLWTTPESLFEKLPYCNQTGDLVITADARIDNREELIAALQINNRPADKIVDSELILAAYEKWGEDCPQHLLGDFAFAIWDERKQVLFCARDHMGVKPFYYYSSNNTFVFGSEIKAIFCLSGIPRRLNEVKIGEYLVSMSEDKSITFYQDILRLPPACCISISLKGIQIRSYWSLDPERELKLGSNEEYAEALREVFTEAVRCRLRSAFPIGSHLSGGLDSSSVTCVARNLLAQHGTHQLHTFSNVFDAVPQCDERPFMNAVIAQGGLKPHFIITDQTGPLSELEDIFQYQDQVFLGPNHYQIWIVNRAANKEGIRILLDGFDGDTTLSHGHYYLVELARSGNWATFARELNQLARNLDGSIQAGLESYGFPFLEELSRQGKWRTLAKQTAEISKYFTITQKYLFLQYGLKPLVPSFLKQFRRKLLGHDEPIDNNYWIVNSQFEQEISLKKQVQAIVALKNSQKVTERKAHLQAINYGLITSLMETVDNYASAFNIEARHPFMDKRLLEFCLSLPSEQKLSQGWTRLIMRRAMTNILPQKVQWRAKKTNLSPSFLYSLLNVNRKILDEIMQTNLNNIQAYVDTSSVYKACKSLPLADEIQFDTKENSVALEIFKVVALSLWLRSAKLQG